MRKNILDRADWSSKDKTKISFAGTKSPTTQPREDPIICYLWVPIHLSFNSSRPTLSSLSGPHIIREVSTDFLSEWQRACWSRHFRFCQISFSLVFIPFNLATTHYAYIGWAPPYSCYYVFWARICKQLRRLRIDSEVSILPAYAVGTSDFDKIS